MIAGATPSINTPSGWTPLPAGTSSGPFVNSAVFYKVGDGSTSVTVTLSATALWIEAIAFTVDDADLSSLIDASGKASSNGGILHSATSVGLTTTSPNELVVGFWGFESSGAVVVTPPTGMSELLAFASGGPAEQLTAMVATYTQAAAGSTGTRQARSSPSCESANLLFAIKRYPGPSVPILTYPNGGESLTAGAVVNVTWTPSTSPTAAPSSLKYNLDYSSNNGVNWTSIVSLTGAGVTSFAWTVPSAPISGGYLVRIRAYDPALSLYSLTYDQSNAAFSVVTETAPGQPIITSPASGSVQNKAALVPVAWNHAGGLGNPQTQFTLQWSRDNFASHTATVGPTTTTTQGTSINFSAETNGTTISVRVKTRGVSLYSAYSNIVTFVVANAPSAPNITAPTAGAPPNQPLPTISFTVSDFFVSRKWRVVQGGAEVYNSGEVPNTALSFPSLYSFANGVPSILYLSIKNSFNLWSAEDSETFTPTYTGPAKPTLTVNVVDDGGYVLLQIANSDSATNELWVYVASEGRASAIRISPTLPTDASFSDYQRIKGTAYKYFARAYNGSGLFTDSDDSATIIPAFSGCFLHAVSRDSTSSNALGSPLQILLQSGSEWGFDEVAASHKIKGLDRPIGVRGQAAWQRANIVCIGVDGGDTLAKLMAIFRLRGVVCIRDYAGHRILGKMSEPLASSVTAQFVSIDEINFTVVEEKYREAI